jgi:hypothetical protein
MRCSSGENFSVPFTHKIVNHENFVKRVEKTVRGLPYVRNKFPNVSDVKIKQGKFIVSQIRKLMQNKQFDEELNETERNARWSYKRFCKDFLGNRKAAKYQDFVQVQLTSYKAMRSNT